MKKWTITRSTGHLVPHTNSSLDQSFPKKSLAPSSKMAQEIRTLRMSATMALQSRFEKEGKDSALTNFPGAIAQRANQIKQGLQSGTIS